MRFLDNCNDINRGPIPEVEETVRRHRRVGLGVMGWADLLGTLGIPYDSQPALDLAEELMGAVTATARAESVELADEKGPCPALRDRANEVGARPPRNLQATTVAPTGTISMVAGCNSGIEPYFALSYTKHIRGGEQAELVAAPLLRALRERGVEPAPLIEAVRRNGGSLQGVAGVPQDLCRAFPTAREIPPEWHVRMQAAFQKHTDNAVSKTINLPHQSRPEDVEGAFFLAWKLGCKGVTAYRDGSRAVQVLEVPLDSVAGARSRARGSTVARRPADVCEFRRAPAGGVAPNGAAVPGPFQFRCPECEGTDYHVEAGCPDAVCNACGWRRGNCG
jgi:ribonucleoside-diphosphate reductase alpha chain